MAKAGPLPKPCPSHPLAFSGHKILNPPTLGMSQAHPSQPPKPQPSTYPSTNPCLIPWRKRNAAYLSAVYLGALPLREAPAIL